MKGCGSHIRKPNYDLSCCQSSHLNFVFSFRQTNIRILLSLKSNACAIFPIFTKMLMKNGHSPDVLCRHSQKIWWKNARARRTEYKKNTVIQQLLQIFPCSFANDRGYQLCYLIKETLICEARQPFVPLDNVPKLSWQLSHKQMN